MDGRERAALVGVDQEIAGGDSIRARLMFPTVSPLEKGGS